MCGSCNVWLCVCVDFVMFGCVCVFGFCSVRMFLCVGFCNVWVCVSVGLVMCGCVKVWVLLCVAVCMCGFCNV